MKFATIITALFASSLVAAAPAPVPAPADGDSVAVVLGYKREPVAEDLGYKRDAAPEVEIAAKKDKRFCRGPQKA